MLKRLIIGLLGDVFLAPEPIRALARSSTRVFMLPRNLWATERLAMAPIKRISGAIAESSNKRPKLITEFFAQNGQRKSASTVSKAPNCSSQSAPIEALQTATLAGEIQNDVENASTREAVAKHNAAKSSSEKKADNYEEFCSKFHFNKQAWLASLSDEEKILLSLEINTMHITWLAFLHKEFTKPYFLKLKRFLQSQKGKTVFPPPGKIYSWSHYTPLPNVKCLVLGQDPYHNHNQAHGLAFLVLEPTRPPPSLVNIYKALKLDFADFEVPDFNKLAKAGKPGGGNLTEWAKRGVLMLNACLTVEAHKANSHANQGWEKFTEQVILTAITYAREENRQGFVIMAWGSPAQKRVAQFSAQLSKKDVEFLVLKSVHPSPLLASRGWFQLQVFRKCNEWLKDNGKEPINWGVVEGNDVW